MKRNSVLRLIATLLLTTVLIYVTGRTHAQTTVPSMTFLPVNGTHTLCTPVAPAGTMTICGATDGPWVSWNGGAFVQIQTGEAAAGVTSISVNGGTAQTGAVALTIPTTATTTGTFTTTIH